MIPVKCVNFLDLISQQLIGIWNELEYHELAVEISCQLEAGRRETCFLLAAPYCQLVVINVTGSNQYKNE